MIRAVPSPGGAERTKPFEPVVRERLVEHLARACENKVTLVVAPAGFGKTVAIRHYLARGEKSVLHFGLRGEHGATAGFVRGLAEAFAPAVAIADETVAGICERLEREETTADELGAWLATLLKKFDGLVVLDDLHHARADPRVVAFVAEAVERSSPKVRWLLATRDPLDLPVASWLAYGRMELPLEERELRLTSDEAAGAAQACGVKIKPTELEELLRLTDGWPTAFAFALRISTRASDLAAISAGTREMIFAYLAEQVFRGLRSEDREFLLESCVLPSIDLDAYEAVGREDAAAAIERLRHETAFITPESERVFRYHDLFREYVERELRKLGRARVRSVHVAAARILEAGSRTLEALALYVGAKSPDDVARLIDAEGLALYDAGHVAELERALAVVDAERRAHDPLVLAVEGLIRGFRDDAEGAHASLGAARAQATNDPELAAELAYRHAYVAYHSSGFKAALAVMGPKSADRISDPARRARTLGARAFFVALDERLPEADELATKALRAIERCGESVDKALVLRLAATVAFHCGRSEEARTLALEAVRLAEKLGLPGLTARFATELYLIAYRLGDVALAKWTLALVAREAERAADHPALRFALVNGYEFSVEQGDERRLEELEREIRANPRRVSSDEVLASAVAFQLAWNRDFSQAATTVEALSASIQQPARLGFLRGFEFVFWTAGGRRAEAEAALASASAALEKVGPERYGRDRLVYTKARAWLAVGLLSLGRNQSALREIRELEGQRQTHPGIKALVVALRALHLHAETGAADSEVRSAFAKLSRAGYGGYARLLEALPIRSTPAVAPVFGALTPAEIEVLRGIAEGATSRSLAQQLGRSHFTIDSHVKAIVRKLGCPGRREAIQMARAHGLA